MIKCANWHFNKRITLNIVVLMAALLILMLGVKFYDGNMSTVYAEEKIIHTGKIAAGRTDVRIREEANTSCGVITYADGGLCLDIYEIINTTDTYTWYKVGFYLNGEYKKGYVVSDYVTIDAVYEEDGDFESYLTQQNFPESYKDALRQLHAKYPKWVFVADHTGKDWKEVVKNQNVTGRSLIYGSAISSWKSIDPAHYDYSTGKWYEWDSGGWVQASSELVEYALDPRNFLDETSVFMFEKLSYDNAVHSESGVSNVVAGTFMQSSDHDLTYNGTLYNYQSGLMLAGRMSGVSPYHLASRIIQEQGSDGRGYSIAGTNSGYEGIYNYYNWGAVKSTSASAVTNGLIYASRTDSETLRPWNSRMLSIIGGAIKLGKEYINRGQNTIYYEKFDLISPYWHQYMTNVLAPRSESVTAARAYSSATKESTAFVFSIPVYNDMPEKVCEIPTGEGSPNNTLSQLFVSGYSLTPTFSTFEQNYDIIVDYNVRSLTVNATANDGNASVSGLGTHSLSVGSNEIKVVVTAPNGYYRTYTITVIRKEKENDSGSSSDKVTITTEYDLDNSKSIISGIGVSTEASAVAAAITCSNGGYAKVLASDGTQKSGSIATGDRVVIYSQDGTVQLSYDVVIYGDLDGNGLINVYDLIYIRRHMLDIQKLDGVYYEAADTSRRGGDIDAYDLIYLRRHLLDIAYIEQ